MTAEKSRPEKMSIRLPDELRDTIELLAEESQRSMNSEIVFLLEQALKPKSTAAELPDAVILTETIRRFKTKLFAEVTVTEKQLRELKDFSARDDDGDGLADHEPD